MAQRLNGVERDVKKLKDEDSDYESDSDVDSEYDDDDRLGWEDMTIPDVRDANFERFKNRYTKEEGMHCIEVLMAGSDLNAQICKELHRREEFSLIQAGIRVDKDDLDEPWIRRVRLQSPGLLLMLDQIVEMDKTKWNAQNRRTFYRPFSLFIFAQEAMREKLVALEEKFSDESLRISQSKNPALWKLVSGFREFKIRASEEQHDSTTGKPTVEGRIEMGASGQVSVNNDEDSSPSSLGEWKSRLADALLESYHTLLELRCYVNFVDQRIIPQSQKFDDPKSPGAQKIRFDDLYYLFRPGELVYWPATAQSDMMASPTREVFRLYGTDKPPATAFNRSEPVAHCRIRRKNSDETPQMFTISFYAIDYNGNTYGAIDGNGFSFPHFLGFRDVVSLRVYPLRYHPHSDEIIKNLVDGGYKFRDIITKKHVAYCGWALNNSQQGEYNPQYFTTSGMGPPHRSVGGRQYQFLWLVNTVDLSRLKL